MLDQAGKALSGIFAAAAVAGAIATTADPAIPLNGTPLKGLGGVSTLYNDNEIDLLVRGGVTPLEAVGGVVSPVRGITTRTTTGGAQDITWRELTTILIVDDVIPSIRASLRSRFSRTKNTAQTRGAIRSQVIVELENKLRAESSTATVRWRYLFTRTIPLCAWWSSALPWPTASTRSTSPPISPFNKEALTWR